MDQLHPVRVLYMEDDAGVARLFQKKLHAMGYEVDLAEDGQTGLEMYSAGHYDVVVVDHNMPEYDGLQVIRILIKRNPTLPLLMITGAGDEQIAVEAMKLGAGDYLVKDMVGGYLELVPTVIEQLLLQDRLRRERQEALAALERKNNHLTLLNRLGQALSATLDTSQITRQLLRAATEIINAEGSSVWFWADDQRTWLTCKALLCRGEYFSGVNLSMPVNHGLVGRVARNLEAEFVADAYQSVAEYPEINMYMCLEGRSLLAVPLRVRDTVMGVLELVHKSGESFTGEDLALIETLAASAAIAIDNAGLVDTMRRQAVDLQIQNEDLDAFAHTVAHDLKGPIGIIKGYADLLLEEASEFEQTQRNFVEQIALGGRRVANIIDELLLLAEIRNVDVKLVPLNMTAIIDDTLMRLKDMITTQQARVSIPQSWPNVLGYAPWVEEVCVNYLSNALKYGSQPPEIELGATSLDNGKVQLWIRNRGPELRPEERARLFKPFMRLNQVQVKGHGLGLSIVRRIAEKLGGEAGVDNEPGYGPVFSFTLPLHETLESQMAQPSSVRD